MATNPLLNDKPAKAKVKSSAMQFANKGSSTYVMTADGSVFSVKTGKEIGPETLEQLELDFEKIGSIISDFTSYVVTIGMVCGGAASGILLVRSIL